MKTLIIIIALMYISACATVPSTATEPKAANTGLWIAAGIVVVGAVILSSAGGSSDSPAKRNCFIVVRGDGSSDTVCN